MSEQNEIESAIEAPITLEEFFQNVPPGQERRVTTLTERRSYATGATSLLLKLPILHLHCVTPNICEGTRRFGSSDESIVGKARIEERFVTYICKNCSAATKTFAIRFQTESKDHSGTIFKFGEVPNFGRPTPARLARLLGDDAVLFSKGRVAENQGMGIAAFAYYRRVIESQKDAIFDEIIRVSKAIGADKNVIQGLIAGKKQIQFSSAIQEVEVALPPALMINGYNPLSLLHSALSKGLHAGTDAECLANATDTRVVMVELVKRLAEAMKDDAELKSAVARLANRKPSLV